MLSAFLAFSVMTSMASAQDTARYAGVSTIGQKGVTRTVNDIMKAPDLISPIRHLNSILKATEFEVERKHLPQNPASPRSSQWPPPTGSAGNGNSGIASPQGIGLQFDGDAGTGIYPPDTFGAVGPTQIMVTTNGRVRVWNKDGTAGPLNVTLDSFFSGVGGASGTSDPRVTYDRVSQRWFVVCLNLTSPNRIMLGVSSGPTITGTGSFTFYFVAVPSAFADYPSLGVDANGVYVGENTFNTALTSFLGCNITVIQKSSVLSGGPIFSTRFQVATSSGAGPFAPRGVDNDDPASTEGYIIGPDNATFGTLMMRKVFNPGSNAPTISGNLSIPVLSTTFPEDVPASGSTSRLDSLDDRIFHAQMHLNRKTGLRTIWCAHNIEVDANGNASSVGSRNGARWYEVNPATPSLVQAGTSFDNSGSPMYRWIPSCAMSGQGHMALAFNAANASSFVRCQCAGRLYSDPLGTVQAPTEAFASSVAYNAGLQNGAYRWGDYSMVNVDPADDQTMWAMMEYPGSASQWRIRVVKLIAPPPSAVTTVTPNSANPGDTLNVTVSGSPASGSEYYDTDANYPARLVAAFSGGGITVNSITFNHSNPQQFVANITVAGNAASGARNLTVTNPDGQNVTGNGVFTVNAGGTQETLAPTAQQVVLGQISSGDLASLAADDSNAERMCRFILPNRSSPFVVTNLTYTTTKSTLSAISMRVKAKMTLVGQFAIKLGLKDQTQANVFDTILAETTIGTSYATFTGNASGTLSKYLSGSSIVGQISVRNTGPVPGSGNWCTDFEFAQLDVTGN
ncbi:MAG: hypothetical protein JSS66_16100 [Armatimonadetes bacterium]|nr:hypothetical protein [Armatimonadota bacterium]